jgi:hypothetical protein
MEVKIRKEVTLDAQTMAILKIQADIELRKLKNYMEYLLKQKASEFELTEEYKLMMDELLERHNKGKLQYLSEDEFRKATVRK